MKNIKITQTQAIKEMEFLVAGYTDLTDCGNPSKENLRLKEACKMAVVALKEQRTEGHWKYCEQDPALPTFRRMYFCSECGTADLRAKNYCSECGAKMKGVI